MNAMDPETLLPKAVARAWEQSAGLALGHGIFILGRCAGARLMSHELRHVHQYERLGGIEPFLRKYLQQVISVGYWAAPLEQDARAHEVVA
jgi:hypothetical protein